MIKKSYLLFVSIITIFIGASIYNALWVDYRNRTIDSWKLKDEYYLGYSGTFEGYIIRFEYPIWQGNLTFDPRPYVKVEFASISGAISLSFLGLSIFLFQQKRRDH